MYSSLVLLAFIISLGLQGCLQSAVAMTHVHFTIVCLQCKKVTIFKGCFIELLNHIYQACLWKILHFHKDLFYFKLFYTLINKLRV